MKPWNWKPLLGYEGVYWINSHGAIKNARNQVLKPLNPQKIELRNNGQRRIHLISQLLEENFGGTQDGRSNKEETGLNN